MKSVQIRSFLWSVCSRIHTEYREIQSISPCSVRMRGNTDKKKLRIWTLFTKRFFQLLIHNVIPCNFIFIDAFYFSISSLMIHLYWYHLVSYLISNVLFLGNSYQINPREDQRRTFFRNLETL